MQTIISLSFSLQNLAMFLSMLVAWMIPDVPRSLREQLKKENMMLMEFLLNQDQEARVKSHSPARSMPCFPANIDIVVEAPLEEHEEQQVEEGEAEGVEINLDEARGTSDSDPEVGRPFEEIKGNAQEEQGDDVDRGGEVDGGEREKDEEVNEEDGKGDNEQEGGEEKEEGAQREEEESEQVEADEICTVDLDSFMSELGLLGEKRKLNVRFLFSEAFVSCD